MTASIRFPQRHFAQSVALSWQSCPILTRSRIKTIHISNGVTTQEELLATTEKTLDEKWTRISYPLVENRARVVQSIAEHGYTSVDQFVGTLRTAFFGGKMVWEQTDNALLGLDDSAEKVDILEEMARIAKLRPKANRESDSRTHSV